MCCCTVECVKCFLYFLDIVFLLSGVGLFITGIHVLVGVTSGAYASLLPGISYMHAAYILIILGVFIIVVSIVGCIAAIRESVCCLLVFYFMVVIVICLEVSAIIIAFAGLHLHDDMADYVRASMKRGLYLYTDPDYTEMKTAWDSLQEDAQCCGVSSPQDWEITGGFPPGTVPNSCCSGPEGACITHYEEGCEDIIMAELRDWLVLIGVVCLIFVIIQVLLIWFILILFFKLHRGSKRYCCGCCGVYSYVKEID
ncbi:tetraspanin-9-like [Diadema antillarum]|uniref:tetraspanin-9-like n=1 Tax=Diadema antillarum TaxID=105358 RepID=UPI003A86BB04